MRLLYMRRMRRARMSANAHLSSGDVAAIVDRSISRDARERAERHLSSCQQCRDELVECTRLANTAPTGRVRRVPWAWVGVAAAAGIIAVATLPRATGGIRHDASQRGGEPHATRILTFAPTGLAIVSQRDLRFVWQRDGVNTNYRITVVDANGTNMWRTDVSDTSVAPPARLRLAPGARYFWRVEALHVDGSVSQSLMTSFRIAP
jgi:ElaB/YqjD/DUF883 family membrane-anchored ribosome-binding protein